MSERKQAPDAQIKVRDNGPYRLSGDFTLIDVEGNEFELDAEVVALCRCGHSQSKPFCDGSHKRAGFSSTPRADG